MFATIAMVVFLFSLGSCYECSNVIHISCQSSNDLYGILQKQKNLIVRIHNSPFTAASDAEVGGVVIILSDEYPFNRVNLSEEFFKLVREKNLRVFLEYPSYLPGVELGKPVKANLERAVVNSSFFKNFPDSLNILNINGLSYIPAHVKNSHIVIAKVAGFDKSIFGLPENTSPLLFELPDYNVLVSTTKLSNFVKGRYSPRNEWVNVWMHILTYLMPETQIAELQCEYAIEPMYGETEKLPANFQKESITRGIEWFSNAKMLAHKSYDGVTQKIIDEGNQRLKWDKSMPVGNGQDGVYECIFSQIDENGNQPIGIIKRGDCISETAMTFACAGTILNNQKYIEISNNLLDFYLVNSEATKNEYGNPKHGAYGLIPWGISNEAWYKASYGDDNARFFISALTTSVLAGIERWDETLMKTLLSLLRTTGINGFRGNRIDLPDFEKNGWEYYYNQDIINMHPHFEAYLWACMLWAYDKTGDLLFLERTRDAIHKTMANYPDNLKWANGLAQEKARMLLPLAWLVRIENTPKNRTMLLTVVNSILDLQDECGAIREEVGDLKMGRYPPPQSNEAYGTKEASLISQNGDLVCDLLYTTNFAFLGLHEAYYATNDFKIKVACDKLAEFLCRIQVASKDHPEVDGGWMRAFDFGRYEHWGSNADLGWGAWAIESGWTQGWILSVLALREMDTSIWDLTKKSKLDKYYIPLKKQMLPPAIVKTRIKE